MSESSNGYTLKEPNIRDAHEIPPDYGDIEQMYWNKRSRIKKLYRDAELWHGTGRYTDKGKTDVLLGMVEHNSLLPNVDIWDTGEGEMETISTTWMRPYAALYADMHQKPEEELKYIDKRTKPSWGKKIRQLTAIRAPLSILKNATALMRTKNEAKAWIEKKIGTDLGETGDENVLRFFRRRSSISGNYPILLGIKSEGIAPVKTSQYLAATETRTDKPIVLSNITHIEVPLEHLEETKKILNGNGISIPVIPRELGERYQSEFSDRELITGEGFQESEYPVPASPISKDELSRYVPKKEWFRSQKQSESPYHGVDHLTRVLVLQETLATLLIESGDIRSDQIDREALRWSAMTHDIRRHSDIIGIGHAASAANWVESVLPADMNPATRDKIYKIVKAHDQEIDPLSDIALELGILKDADVLDRLRLEKKLPSVITPRVVRKKITLDPSRLRHEAARKMIPLANELYRLSTFDMEHSQNDPGDAVLDAATKMGLFARKS